MSDDIVEYVKKVDDICSELRAVMTHLRKVMCTPPPLRNMFAFYIAVTFLQNVRQI